jgi:hypothetical protein
VIAVCCDICGKTASAIWNYRTRTWRIPSEWETYVVYDKDADAFQHACSSKCHVELAQKLVKPRGKPALTLIK